MQEVKLRLPSFLFWSMLVGACGTRGYFLFISSLIRYHFSGTTSAWRGQMMLHIAARRGLLRAQKRGSCIVGVCRGWEFGARHACIHSERDLKEIPCFQILR